MLRRVIRSSRRLPRVPVVAALTFALVVGPGMLVQPRSLGASQPLRYLGGETSTLDPARIGSAGDVELLLQLYAGLTRMDEAGNVYPSLASSWTVASDGMTYTFHLRGGLRFSDGSPLDASDVRRSWLRLLDPQVHATAPDVLNVIAGATARLAGRIGDDGVGIQAPDASTLVVHLAHPAGYFTAITATPTTFVVPRSADAGTNWQTVGHFVGSGPYVATRTTNDTLVLEANPRYAGGQPPITEVDWLTRIDGDPVSAYGNGDLDLVQIGSADATWIAYDRQLGPALHQGADLSVSYLGFDTTRPPFNDLRVRRAFALALDRTRLVALADGTSATPATSVVPPALQPGSLPKAGVPDPGGARALLDQAGYADRSRLGTITVNATGLDVTSIAATWRKELGVTVSVETMDFRDYIAALDAGQIPQVFSINWVADYPSPHALYDLLLARDATSNYGRWRDDRFTDLLDRAAAATTPASQGTAYAAVETEVEAQVPLIPWEYPRASWLVRPGLRGLGTLTVGLLDLGLVSWGP